MTADQLIERADGTDGGRRGGRPAALRPVAAITSTGTCWTSSATSFARSRKHQALDRSQDRLLSGRPLPHPGPSAPGGAAGAALHGSLRPRGDRPTAARRRHLRGLRRRLSREPRRPIPSPDRAAGRSLCPRPQRERPTTAAGDRLRQQRLLAAAPPALASRHAAHPCAPPLSRDTSAMPAEIDPDWREIVTFQKRFLLRRRACLADVVSATPAQAKRILGTKGPDRLVGTAKADVIKALRGEDRVRGRRGRDRLFGGRGADRLDAVDGGRDRLVRGGPGKDVCRIDAADRAKVRAARQ